MDEWMLNVFGGKPLGSQAPQGLTQFRSRVHALGDQVGGSDRRTDMAPAKPPTEEGPAG